jgi:hypothetical protein
MSEDRCLHVHDLALPHGSGWPDEAWRSTFACRECGLRTLIVLMNSAKWVMRRVERVSFHDDRTVARRVSMDFVIPGQAPRYRVPGGGMVCLLPLTVMRRKTLVNFGLTDANGQALSLVSLRHNQALTEQMILALAEVTPHVSPTAEIEEFANAIAFGAQARLMAAFGAAHRNQAGPDVRRLLEDRGAERLLRRLANNFLLLVTIDVDGPMRRIVRFEYDEPLTLTYKKSGYDSDLKEYRSEPRPLVKWHPRRLAASLGLIPTVVRFPTPAAENHPASSSNRRAWLPDAPMSTVRRRGITWPVAFQWWDCTLWTCRTDRCRGCRSRCGSAGGAG